MKLKVLIKEIPDLIVKGHKDIEVTGICENSKLVSPGNLFVARRGGSLDGARYIPDAIAAGAVAILTEIYNPFVDAIQLIHPDVAAIEALLAARYYGDPSKELLTVAITGTNGKTTTSYLIKHLLDSIDMSAGLIGTVEWVVGQCRLPTTMTTPDVCTNQKLLREMVSAGCKSAVMEVTSHALHQNRVEFIQFSRAIFTNLTQDHLDYHLTMQAYAAEKKKLFLNLHEEAIAIVNLDDERGEFFAEDCPGRILRYGINHNQLDVRASEIEMHQKGLKFAVTFKGEKVLFTSPLVGRFNIYNLLAAISLGLSCDIPLEKLSRIFSGFRGVPGRLQRIANPLKINLFIDYAHTPDALQNVLDTLEQIKPEGGRIILVFGCGGNRDMMKRKQMGEIAEKGADFVIITSDNPRNEEPIKIVEDILQGLEKPEKAHIEIDRASAIDLAIQTAKREDIVLIAGKGHERIQIFAGKTIDFDDAAVALNCCSKDPSHG